MVSVAEAMSHSDFPFKSKEPRLAHGPSDNWAPPVWGLNAQEEKGLLGPGLLCLWDGACRLSTEVSAGRGDPQPAHLMMLVEAEDLFGSSIWGHHHLLWH